MIKTTEIQNQNWQEKLRMAEIGRLGSNIAEVLHIFEQMVADRNIEGIQKFYQEVCTDTLDMNDDRDPFMYRFLMQFCNMIPCHEVREERKEPITRNNYLCFKCVYHRDEPDEFSVMTFFKKQELTDYKYNCFLMYNNLVGIETYLHTYEFKEPIFEERYMIQCNNLVLSFKLDKTEQENLVHPMLQYNEDWVGFIYGRLEQLGLTARNVLVNGEDLTVVVDLWRTVTLKSSSLKYILEKVEEQLLLRLQDFHIYDNKHFFMVPGSINTTKHISINRKTTLMFSNKEIEGNTLVKREDGYLRCYYVGTDCYSFPAVSLTKLAETVGFPKKAVSNIAERERKRQDKKIENKKRYTHVGFERLEDLDKLISLRQEEISERFNFFRIMGNTLFYLGKEATEVLQYMDERNKKLYEPVRISENCLLRIFTFCKEDYEKYLSNPKLGIKYTNEKIVELLQIRPFEQLEMKQLIGKDEAEKRIRISDIVSKRKAYEPTKQKNQTERNKAEDTLRQELLLMRQKDMGNYEIAKKKGFDIRKVDRLIGKNMEKQNEKDLLRQQVADMTLGGMTASEISIKLNVSISTIRRIRAKIQQ